MDLITYRRLEAIREANFWKMWYVRSDYQKMMRALRRVTGGEDPIFEGWLLFTGEDFCPWYEEEMKKYT